MARLWSCGFELNSAVGAVEFDAISGTGLTIQSVTKRNGDFAAKYKSAVSSAGSIRQSFQADTVNTNYHRFYLNVHTRPAATIKIWEYLDSGLVNVGFSLQITSAGIIQMVNDINSATVLASSSALNNDQWYRMEIKIVDNATTAAQMELKIDGTIVSTNTGLTGMNGGGVVILGAVTFDNTAEFYLDDIAINDTTGTAQTAYPGAGSIVHMQPDSAGDNAAWTAGVGGTANWNRVSEVSPDDATTYNQQTIAGTVIDDHNVESSASAGIGSSDTITLIQVGLRGGSTATTVGATVAARIKSAATGTVSTGAAGNFAVNGWNSHTKTTPKIYQLTSYLDPTTGVAWTPTGTNSLDNMQIGYTNTASNTTVRRVSTVWALVEFVPSAGATFIAAKQKPIMQAINRASIW